MTGSGATSDTDDASVPVAHGSAKRADELLRQLTDSRQRQWYRHIQELPSDRRGACLDFLLDVALRRAVRRSRD